MSADPALDDRAEAVLVAPPAAVSTDHTARWNGKDALRAFAKADAKAD